MGWTPRLEFVEQGSGRRFEFPVELVLNGGYAGRDQTAVWKHVEELAEIGVPVPTRTPILFALGNHVAATVDSIQVQHGKTSGEVEYVLLVGPDDIYVTVGSDHTDRGLECTSIEWSKQIYPDLLAPEVWRYQDVVDHWDDLVLRCWVTAGGERRLYQEATLADLLPPKEWLGLVKEEFGPMPGHFVLMSGTPPAQGGICYGDSYDLELHDPVLGRTLRHSYQVELLHYSLM